MGNDDSRLRPESALVIGGDSVIGKAVATRLRQAGEHVIETTRRKDTLSETRVFLDLTEPVSEWLVPVPVKSVFLCAGVTSVRTCAQDPASSRRINVDQPLALAQSFVENGAFVTLLSTNLVFDGSKPKRADEEPTCPATEYGRQKAALEQRVRKLGKNVAIIRCTKVISPRLPLFVDWLTSLQDRRSIQAFSDMVMSPVPLSFVAEFLCRIADRKLSGIWQISGRRDISYFEAALHLALSSGAEPGLVHSSSAATKGFSEAELAQHATLDTSRLHSEFGVMPPDVWTTIESVLPAESVSDVDRSYHHA